MKLNATTKDIKKWLKDDILDQEVWNLKLNQHFIFKHHGEKVVITSIDKIEDALNNKAVAHY